MPVAQNLEEDFLNAIGVAGYKLIAIEANIALRAGRLTGAHRDPFDRMIAAQALSEDIPVISNDDKLDGFGVRRLW